MDRAGRSDFLSESVTLCFLPLIKRLRWSRTLGRNDDKELAMTDARVHLTVELTEARARDLAQFLKRVGFSEFERNARDEDEAYAMQEAAGVVRRALTEAGYEPR